VELVREGESIYILERKMEKERKKSPIKLPSSRKRSVTPEKSWVWGNNVQPTKVGKKKGKNIVIPEETKKDTGFQPKIP